MALAEPEGLPAWETQQARELRPAWAATPMCSGEPRRRRTVRQTPSVLSLRRVLTGPESAAWWAWWRDATLDGAVEFDALVARLGGGVETIPVQALTPPQATPKPGGIWEVSLDAITRLVTPGQTGDEGITTEAGDFITTEGGDVLIP